MVSPVSAMLSVFKTPCTKPTDCHAATSRAVRATTSAYMAAHRSSGELCAACILGKSTSVLYSTSGVSISGSRPALGPAGAPSGPAGRQTSKEPNRRNERATRATTAQCSSLALPLRSTSRSTRVSEVTSAAARVVGMPRWCIASEQRNSRIDERSTLRPSAVREKGVSPAPLSCSSHRSPSPLTSSPIYIAAPSPSCPAKVPNWWPQ
mmetsp:Transcript_13105/g.30909  ORF Transcript_13105/g.30909 Transcript_13105/m.30909 type:complete len:208 (-) Transcript_13105:414-1037(-)